MIFDDKGVVVTGGTGSLGRALVGQILSGETGRPRKLIVMSRDVSEEEAPRTKRRGQYYVIQPMLAELEALSDAAEALAGTGDVAELSSADRKLNIQQTRDLLAPDGLLVDDVGTKRVPELLR